MTRATGVELGPDSCVLVAARRGDSAIEIGAVRVFDPAEWSDDPALQALRLKEARQELALPRRATVVVWEQARSGSRHSPEAVLEAAGFKVSAISPFDALAQLASTRPDRYRTTAVAYLSINHHGAAIAVVRDADILYSREFPWQIQAPDQRVQANVLRRYLYAAQIAPELRRAGEAVERQSGAAIQSAVVCGNVPDLRSLTMPLIRELDLEFETLDAMDGLAGSGPAASAVPPIAASLRLAAAAASLTDMGSTGTAGRWLITGAGALVAAAAVWVAFAPRSPLEPVSAPAPPSDTPPVSTRAQPSGTAGSDPSSASSPEPAVVVPERPVPPRQDAEPSVGVSHSVRRDGGSSAPAEEPWPSVGGVLIASDRRLAVVDGAVVGVGDKVGQRVVAQIDMNAVVLRDSSGRQIRVPVRSRSGTELRWNDQPRQP